uniref:Uncharacterized protein n=1 Tax=Pseudomonas phage RVTF4 TaxID=3236931 RepID=A0AB39CCG9_9VIRU
MQLVAYIEIPTGRDMAPQRWYFQEAESFGMSQPYYEHSEHQAPLCALDSRVRIFTKPKQILDLFQAFRGTDPNHRTSTFGYHGITEAGNACKPFATVHKGEDRQELFAKIGKQMSEGAAWAKAMGELGIPMPWVFSPVAVGRKDTELDKFEVIGLCQSHIMNQMPEDEEAILTGLAVVSDAGWRFTTVEIHGPCAFVHMSRVVKGKDQHASAVITAFNLMDATDIAQMKEDM